MIFSENRRSTFRIMLWLAPALLTCTLRAYVEQYMNSQSTPALARIRTDVVGSLLRPVAVREGRVALDEGRMTAAALQAIEDDAVRAAVRLQEAVGLDIVTDGE